MPSNYSNRSSKKAKPAAKRSASPSPVSKSQSIGEKTSGYEREGEDRHPSGREWKRKVANVIAAYGGICHLCDHPGALQADHVVVRAESRDDSIANLRPAHGSAGKWQRNPCPVCGLNCNNIRGALSVEAGRRKIARRIEALGLTDGVNEPFDW